MRTISETNAVLCKLSLVFLVALFVCLGSTRVTNARVYKAELDPQPCPTHALRALEAECYRATLPETHGQPAGKRIDTPVAVLKGDGRDWPVFYFPGGPGGSYLDREDTLRTLKAGAGGRDLVVFAYRGGRGARPELDCDPAYRRFSAYYNAYSPLVYGPGAPTERFAQLTDYVASCHRQLLEQGVKIQSYTQYQIAFDVEAIRKALGYKKMHVAGHSAGGGSVFTQARLFPKSVASIIAEAPWPIWTRNRSPIDEYNAARTVYAQLLSPYVGRRFGDYQFSLFDIDRARRDLDADPFETVVDEQTFRFDGAGLMHRLYVDLPEDLEALAAFIAELADGDRSGLQSFIGAPQSITDEQGATPWGLYFASVCGDMGAQKITKSEAVDLIEAEPALLGFEPNIACPWWETEGAVDPEHNRPLSLDTPVLLITGERDTCCGKRIADELRRVSPVFQAVDLIGVGHAVFGPCRNNMVRQFLDNPTKQIDATCAQ